MQDRFLLLSWALNYREALRRRKCFLDATFELKRKLRKVLYMWQDKKAEDNFRQLTDLILNFDKQEEPKETPKKAIGKLSKRNNKRIKKTPVLQTVEEREEELEETIILEDGRDDSSEDLLEEEEDK